MPLRASYSIFKKPSYILLTLGAATVALFFTVIVSNWLFITSLFNYTDLSAAQKWLLVASLFTSLLSDWGMFKTTFVFLAAILLGINVALFSYLIRRGKLRWHSSAAITSSGGFLVALFGIGCAACGSFMVTALLALTGSGLLILLPLGGLEFSILGAGLLFLSSFILIRTLNGPAVCPTD